MRKTFRRVPSLNFTTILLTVPGRPVALFISFFSAFVTTLFGSTVPSLPFEMVNTCFRVQPYDGIFRAVLPCFLLCLVVLNRWRKRCAPRRKTKAKYEEDKENERVDSFEHMWSYRS